MNATSLARSLARSQRSFHLMGLFALGAGAIACARQSEDDSTRTPASQPIQLGWDDDDTPARNATALIQKAGGGFCTASLVTSRYALTATHCEIQAGDTIIFGAENENVPGRIARAKRAITGVIPNLPGVSAGDIPLWQRARDVSIVRFDPPITMQASPKKPSFQRPALSAAGPLYESGTINGGISGYGIVKKWFTNPDGGTTFYDEHEGKRQVATSTSFDVLHMDTGSGYAVWINKFQTNVSSGEPHGYHGDSGGPLFRQLTDEHDARDVLGVFSGWSATNCWPLPASLCGADYASDVYADITAPAMRAWIEGELDPSKDGRWASEVDYVRSTFGTPGCGVNANPSCDPGCNAAKDADCDLIFDENDNCWEDYNPDQLNTDDPVSFGDPSSHDPGDACDLCPSVLDTGVDNCNSDAEILKWGPRPRLRENDVIGPDPLIPSPQPIVELVKSRYAGDKCDWAPCTELGAQMLELDAVKYGAPDPTQGTCVLTQEFGGHCSFQAKAQIQHDGRWLDFALTGHTGYRFCRCDGPFAKQADRIQNCFLAATGPLCPPAASAFAVSPKLVPLTVDPSPSPIPGTSPLEFGTPDVFTANKKAAPPVFTWLFEQDVNAIMGPGNPSPPFTSATAAAFAIDGLLQSNVRQTSSVLPAYDADLESYWLPTRLRVEPNVFGGAMAKTIPFPDWWTEPCPTGLTSPWELVTEPTLPPALFTLTAKGPLNITSSVDSAALTLLRNSTDISRRVIIPAAEHRTTLSRLAKPFAPRVTVADPAELAFIGAVGQDADGRLVLVRGLSDAIGASAMIQSSSSKAVVATKTAGGGAAKATLSAIHGALYVLRKPSGGALARLHVFDVLREEWTERPLRGDLLPETPLALTYAAQPDALFALDRSNGANGTVRLFRIRLDGRVELLAQGFGIAQSAEVFLTASELGLLVLSVGRTHPARYAVLELDAFGATAKATRLYKASGTLRGSPFVTERALHVLVSGSDGDFKALELDTAKMAPAHPNKWGLPDLDI